MIRNPVTPSGQLINYVRPCEVVVNRVAQIVLVSSTLLMRARSVVEGRGWTALGGPHHALGDCLATLEVLHGIAGRPT